MPKGRTKLTDNGSSKPLQYKRAVPTNHFRLTVVQYFQVNGMASTLERFFTSLSGPQRDTKRKSIHLWCKRIDTITAACEHQATSDHRRMRKQGTATILPSDAEQDILKWVNYYRAQGAPISATMLKRKALQIAKEVGVSLDVFSASWSWRRALLTRHSLAFRARTRQGQKSLADSTAVQLKLKADLAKRMKELQADVVFNADQTPVFFEHLPKSTIDSKGVNTVWVRTGGKDKERVTYMLLGDSFGRKYAPFLVVKTAEPKKSDVAAENKRKRHGFGVRMRSQMRALEKASGARISGNSTGWWNSELSVQFLEYHFGSRPNKSTPVLLLWDDFSAHWTEKVLLCAARLNIELMKVPSGYTSACQPADIAWNRPLKERLRQRWSEQLRWQLDTHDPAYGAFKLRPPSCSEVVEWVSKSWDCLSASTISDGFNPITEKEETDPSVQERFDYLAHRLEQLNLLDADIGEVTADDDVIDNILESIK